VGETVLLKRILWAATVAASSLVIVGCGVGSPTGSPSGGPTSGQPSLSPTPTPAGVSIGCALAPASEVSAALGISASNPSTTNNSPVTICTYPGGALVRFQTGEDAASFAVGEAGFGQHGESVSDVSGLGDAAYSSSIAGSNTLVTLKGSLEILITSSASLANERVLMQELLARV
jgi:hypothetical protein